jgi:tetratricopeptide (TPR) repeat protein
MVLAAASAAAASPDLKRIDMAAPNAASELNNLGSQYYFQARYAEAEEMFRLALKAWSRRGDPAPDMALTMGNLGTLFRVTGRYAEAEPLLLEAIHRLEAASNVQPASVGRALDNLAEVYRAQGDFAKAEACALRAAADPNQPVILASIYADQRRFAEAEPILRGALPEAPPRLSVTIYNDLATIAIARGQMDEAERNALEAVERARRTLPSNHPTLAATLNNLAQVYRFQGRYLDAEQLYREAIDIWEAALGPEHPDLARGLMNLAAFYHERERETGAEDLYLRAAAIFERVFGRNDPRTLVSRNELADVLRGERRYTESEKLGRSTLAALERVLGADDPRVVRAQMNQSRLAEETKALRKTQPSR